MYKFSLAQFGLIFRRQSHRDVFEHLDEWANSPGLQPPINVSLADPAACEPPVPAAAKSSADKVRHGGNGQ